ERLRARLSALYGSSAEQAVIVQEARRAGGNLEENLSARVAVHEIAQFERVERLRNILAESGLSIKRMEEWKDHLKDPREILRMLRVEVGTNDQGQIVFRNLHEPLITNPELSYPDDALPGDVPSPFQTAQPRDWLGVFTYAGGYARNIE